MQVLPLHGLADLRSVALAEVLARDIERSVFYDNRDQITILEL